MRVVAGADEIAKCPGWVVGLVAGGEVDGWGCGGEADETEKGGGETHIGVLSEDV